MTAVKTTCPYCGVGCGLSVVRREGRLHIDGDAEHPANFGKLCSKGAALTETTGLDGRLLEPEVGGQVTDWDTALDAVAQGFLRTIAAHGRDAVAFYVSGQLLTEDYYVANKLMKGFIGSANIDTNSRLCMASAVAGYKRALGADFVPNTYADVDAADLFVLVGANAAWCHPVLYQRIVQARAERGARVVVIDPRRTATCAAADLHLMIRPGTDVLLLNGLLAYLATAGVVDADFVRARTEGFTEALEAARAEAASLDAVAAGCDVPAATLRDFYAWFATTPRVLTLFSQGVNQSTAGTDKVNGIINVHLATGRIGRPGAGPFSLTGQPNAMGGREVGGLANQLAAHMDFSADSIDSVRRFWGAPHVAARPGLKAVELFAAIAERRVRAVWIMATNPVVSMPAADEVRRALERCDFVVVSDCVRRTDTTVYADVLLPAAAWGEKSGTVTNSERRISRQRAFLPVPGASRPDWWIVSQVARRMGFPRGFDYAGPADIFREHAALSAFENGGRRAFDLGALAHLSDRDYEELAPIQWPVPPSGVPSAPAALARGEFFTPSRKARFVATPSRAPAAAPSRAYPFILNTGRVRDHWHTLTRTGLCARLAQRHAEPFVQVHPEDAARLDIADGKLAELRAGSGRVLARVEVTADVRLGELFAPMHWNAQFANAGRVGTLLAAATDPISGQAELKHAVVELKPFTACWYGFLLSAEPLAIEGVAYRVAAKGEGHWRYELAGEVVPESWAEWVRALCGCEHDWVEFADRAAGRYRAAALRAGRLVACFFVDSTPALDGRRAIASLFTAGPLDARARLAILSAQPGAARADGGAVVCSCFAVGRNTLLEAIRTQKLASAREIGVALRAGTNCGSCLPELNALLAHVGDAGRQGRTSLRDTKLSAPAAMRTSTR
jgi:assimilatory nitrate reductase catalytic subunit